MSRDDASLTRDLTARLPDLDGVSLVAGPVQDHVADLWPEERRAVSSAGPKRVREFSTGRHLARRAMAGLGVAPAAIPRADDHRPIWPDAVTGSITHTADLAVAAVARTGNVSGLGIDLERPARLSGRLYRRIFTEAERDGLGNADQRLPGILFSAKEAGFKAVNPTVGRYIGFQEAEVDVTWTPGADAGGLTLRYIGDHEPNAVMNRGIGHFCLFERYVLTVFIIPHR